MASRNIVFKNKTLTLHKAYISPDYTARTVLVSDTWDYVEMWLKRNKNTDALFYWQQARNFFHAYAIIDKTSTPLLAYYCFLNAAKTLLIVKGLAFTESHGVKGETTIGQTSLSNEVVEFKGGGVLAELCKYYQEPVGTYNYSLKDLLYNLPYIHRAYTLTFKQSELFIPIKNTKFVRSMKNDESWFSAEVDKRYANMHTLKKIPDQFELDDGQPGFVVRFKKRFKWKGKGHKEEDIKNLLTYHRKIRKHVFYIYGPYKLWYIKRKSNSAVVIPRSNATITFASMHKLSELARYNPDKLVKHFESKHNWLLSDFLQTAVVQFIDEISSEITGSEFMVPGISTRAK